MFGYGSNVTSPANFRKSGELQNDLPDASFDDDNQDGVKCIFKTTNTSPGPIKFQRNSADNGTPPRMFQKRHSNGGLENQSDSGYNSNSGSSTGLDVVSENSGASSGLKCVYQSSANSKPKRNSAPVARSHSDAGKFTPVVAANKPASKVR